MRPSAFTAFLLAFCVVAAPVMAETKIEPEKRVLIAKVLELSGTKSAFVGGPPLKLSQFENMIRRIYPDLPAEGLKIVHEEFQAMMNGYHEEVFAAIISLYDRHYSKDEILELTALLETPPGKKMVKIQNLMVAEIRALSRKSLMRRMPNYMQRIEERIKVLRVCPESL